MQASSQLEKPLLPPEKSQEPPRSPIDSASVHDSPFTPPNVPATPRDGAGDVKLPVLGDQQQQSSRTESEATVVRVSAPHRVTACEDRLRRCRNDLAEFFMSCKSVMKERRWLVAGAFVSALVPAYYTLHYPNHRSGYSLLNEPGTWWNEMSGGKQFLSVAGGISSYFINAIFGSLYFISAVDYIKKSKCSWAMVSGLMLGLPAAAAAGALAFTAFAEKPYLAIPVTLINAFVSLATRFDGGIRAHERVADFAYITYLKWKHYCSPEAEDTEFEALWPRAAKKRLLQMLENLDKPIQEAIAVDMRSRSPNIDNLRATIDTMLKTGIRGILIQRSDTIYASFSCLKFAAASALFLIAAYNAIMVFPTFGQKGQTAGSYLYITSTGGQQAAAIICGAATSIFYYIVGLEFYKLKYAAQYIWQTTTILLPLLLFTALVFARDSLTQPASENVEREGEWLFKDILTDTNALGAFYVFSQQICVMLTNGLPIMKRLFAKPATVGFDGLVIDITNNEDIPKASYSGLFGLLKSYERGTAVTAQAASALDEEVANGDSKGHAYQRLPG